MHTLGVVTALGTWLASIGLVGIVAWGRRRDTSWLAEHDNTFRNISRLWRIAGFIVAVCLIVPGIVTQRFLPPLFYLWLALGIYVPVRIALGALAIVAGRAAGRQ
jgi:uncharacterized membrane protein